MVDEQEREQAFELIAARLQHTAIEATIDRLKHHGMQRVYALGADGFSRRVGISMIAANVVRLGRLIRETERECLKRQQRRAAAPDQRRSRPSF